MMHMSSSFHVSNNLYMVNQCVSNNFESYNIVEQVGEKFYHIRITMSYHLIIRDVIMISTNHSYFLILKAYIVFSV